MRKSVRQSWAATDVSAWRSVCHPLPITPHPTPSMKPKAIYLLEADAFSAVFGVAEQDDLAARVDFVAPPLTPATWRAAVAGLREVEVIFSGWGTPPMDAALA